ncbi:MAG: subtilase family serine protease [Myxococcota bacterium]|jgi:subtilase family serine protease
MIPLLLSVSLAAAGEPDLIIDAIDATDIETLNVIELEVTIKNDGDAAAGGFYFDVFTSSDWGDCDDQEWTWVEHVGGLAPGAVVTLTVQVDRDLAKMDDIFMFVDVDDAVAESNEKNNEGIAFVLPEDPGEDRITTDWLEQDNPDCLVDFLDGFGWFVPSTLEMFYAKLRIL